MDGNSSDSYITPISKVHSTFEEAKDFYEKYGGTTLFESGKGLDLSTLAQGKRNLIVGEPGIGKTLLLDRIKCHLDASGCATELVNLRRADCIDRINTFLRSKGTLPKSALLLDALDEIQSSRFPDVLQKIEDVSRDHPDLPIFLSSRWIFISKHATSFPAYRFITISPFTDKQVRDYLARAKHTSEDIDALLHRVMSFSHRMLILQVPRYLSYLEKFLEKKGLAAAKDVSRNELFEFFIYSKLELEDKKFNSDKKAVTKRVLEKLALAMEIYQTNVLSTDELMTFFDEFKSDLKMAALSQITFEVFFDYSLLKNNVDAVEFENTEFQEYLAAKEITRLANPNRAAFSFAVDSDVQEIYPTWFNALTFLVDLQKDLLEQLIEFSGLRGLDFKVVDEGFFTFLSRVDPRNVSLELRRRLFLDSMTYHQRTCQWMNHSLASALPNFYDSTLEESLRSTAAKVEANEGANRFVPLGNIAYIVGSLLKNGAPVDRPFWRTKLITYASEAGENGVLQRHALFALEQLGDETVIDELPDLTGADELVGRAFLSMCAKVGPDNPKSIEYFFDAVRKDDFHGRYGIFELRKPESIRKLLRTFNADETFRREFLDDTNIFRDQDHVLIDRIEPVLDEEIRELSKIALAQSLHFNVAHNAEKSAFIVGLWRLLRKGDPQFVPDMVGRIKSGPNGATSLFFAHALFSEVIEKEDVPVFIDTMLAVGERSKAYSVMLRLKHSNRPAADELYELGRPKLAAEYKQWEERPVDGGDSRGREMLVEFRTLLEPAPAKFSTGVFNYYNQHAAQLDPLLSSGDRQRLESLICDTVFKCVDPIKSDLTITKQQGGATTYTTSSSIAIFRGALIASKRLGIDVQPYRQQIVNFIPFAYSEELRVIFDCVQNITSAEMAPVLEVYRKHKSDLWRHQTHGFVEAIQQYHIVEAAPILKDFVKESECDQYAREKALTVLDSLAPDPAFLGNVFELYRESSNEGEKNLAHVANGLLITSHAQAEAIRWRLMQVVKSASSFKRTSGAHAVSRLEEEIVGGKSFAKPLMQLNRAGFDDEYLALLDGAMDNWAKGSDFYAYAQYLWEITYSYFENLKEGQSYAPLRKLEDKVAMMQEREGANWIAARMVHLRRSYLAYLGKPRNVSEAIRKYNGARAYDDKRIVNSDDLYRNLQDALDTDLRRWIEGEGAYDLIVGEKVLKGKRQQYEKLIQKTLKAQIEIILLKRGFQVEVLREPQLLDEKRTDLFVRYGFVGPVVIEVKLTSNTDMKGSKINQTASYRSMETYMDGYGASHGIFLVIDNTGAKNIPKIVEAFKEIKNVWVQSFDCYSRAIVAKKKVKLRKSLGPRKKK